jgi:hypothetical protein
MYIRKIDIISKLFYYFSTIYFKKTQAGFFHYYVIKVYEGFEFWTLCLIHTVLTVNQYI